MNDQLNHSCSHLMAAAITELWPKAKLTLGPSIENGFYYDVDFGDTKISEADFPVIEEKMHQISPSWKQFSSQELSPAQAKKTFAGNPYKLELIEDIIAKKEPITVYTSGNFSDLCRGGHIDLMTQSLNHFKLLSVAGAYWRGSEKNKMLTRIYGTCWSSQSELNDFVTKLEEAKKRDHKKLGKELGLFVFSDAVGKGLPLLTPKGSTIRRELERFIVDEEIKRDYLHVYTPDIASLKLYEKSGHYPYYKDSMYSPIDIEGELYMLRPMTCPHHFELYLSEPRSYRELPMRIAELAQLYRFEKSGELMGLLRVRTFCLADAHIVCTKDQAKSEILGVLDLIEHVASVIGLEKGTNYTYRLSLGDRSDSKKYFKDDSSWDFAENILRTVLKDRKAPYYEAPGEAAFYGPKIDIQMKNINGKEDTAFTVQYDFVMPGRFNLEYINSEGKPEQPVVIHRSSIGAIERSLAFLIERFAGAFPTWLNPVQVKVLPISQRHLDYAKSVTQKLKQAGIRVELDDRNEKLQAKIRDAQNAKVSCMLILGDKEIESNTVTERARNGAASGPFSIETFIEKIKKEIADRINT